MANLKNFLAFKDNCPVCENPLKFSLFYNDNKKIRFVEEYLQIDMQLNGFPVSGKKRQQVQCNVNFESNDFYIDFLDALGSSLKEVTLGKLKSCQDLLTKKNMQLQKKCISCGNYNYQSSPFVLDFKHHRIRDIVVATESISIRKSILGERYKRFHLANNFLKKVSYIYYDQINILDDAMNGISTDRYLTTPSIIIKDYKELAEKLDFLVTFS